MSASPPGAVTPAPLIDDAVHAASRASNLMAVASGKGGVGKTVFAISLAHALSLKGRKVLLFDGDLGLANVDVQLGLMPTRDLGGVIAGRLTLPQARVPYQAGGFDIIAGRSGAGNLAALAPSRLAALGHELTELAREYDTVVMDLGAGVDRMVRHFASHAGTRLVVVTGEPTSLTDAYAFIKVTVADDPRADLRIVVNEARSLAEGERTFATLHKACETFLNVSPKLAGVVRRDRKVVESIRTQTPLLIKFPTADAAVDIMTIATKLMMNVS